MKPAHWALFFIVVVWVAALFFCHVCPASEISREDIIATVNHLQSLTHEAQAETVAAKAETATIQAAAINLQHERDAWKDDDAKAWAYGKEKALEAHNNAKQRDVVIWAFALAFAAVVLKTFPLPGWWIAAEAALSIGCGYAMGRFALAWLAQFFP